MVTADSVAARLNSPKCALMTLRMVLNCLRKVCRGLSGPLAEEPAEGPLEPYSGAVKLTIFPEPDGVSNSITKSDPALPYGVEIRSSKSGRFPLPLRCFQISDPGILSVRGGTGRIDAGATKARREQ